MKKLLCWALAALLLFTLTPMARAGQERVVLGPARQVFGARDDLLRLYVLDLAGADCMLLTDGREHLLIDVGKANQHLQLAALLHYLGITTVSVFNTHPHGDHAGGMLPLVGAVEVPVFYTVFPEHLEGRNLVQDEVLAALKLADVPVKRLQPGDRVPFENVEIRILRWPEGETPNDLSALLHIRYKGATMLLTADIGPNGQKYFSEVPGLEADILKVPHHGLEMLRTDFLDNVNPAYAFFTHGRGDGQYTWQRLKRRRVPYHFASRGVIVLTTDGTQWSVEQVDKALKLPQAK